MNINRKFDNAIICPVIKQMKINEYSCRRIYQYNDDHVLYFDLYQACKQHGYHINMETTRICKLKKNAL